MNTIQSSFTLKRDIVYVNMNFNYKFMSYDHLRLFRNSTGNKKEISQGF